MRILLVDDHAMFRGGARSILQARYPDAVIAEAGSGTAALALISEFKPDVVIMDLHLPDGDGIEVTARLLAELPSTKIIMVSGESDLAYVDQALQKGAAGYLLKTGDPEELTQAVDAVLAGKLHLCPVAAAAALENYRQALSAIPLPPKPHLSERELAVVRFIADGRRDKEIAVHLHISAKTVSTYRQRAMEKLHFTSTAELVRYAVREGLARP